MLSSSSPSLDALVQIRRSGVRSIHIERDLAVTSVSQGYVLTAQGQNVLTRMLENLNSATPARAWTLTGPYGSGKSYFGLYVMNLLCRSLPTHEESMQQIAAVEPNLADRAQLVAGPSNNSGWLPVAITGYRATLQDCIRNGLRKALQPYLDDPDIAYLVNDSAVVDATAPSRALIEWLEQLQITIGNTGLDFSGTLIVLDEMGKSLEYTAAHAHKADIYLLQELAEFANRNQNLPLAFVGILHQGFEHYAGFLDSVTQREWSKVQGRFEDVAFQEPPHQQMSLVARTIELTDASVVSISMAEYVDAALDSGWRPPLMDVEEFRRVCQQAYPLHPTTLVALPYLFRRLAQNERSIFAYLASLEPFGFQEFIRRETAPAVIRLADLFDYLTANFQGRLYGMSRARLISETLERLEHAPDSEPMAGDVIKTIGLLNWLAEVSPVQATRASLFAALRGPQHTDAEIERVLTELQRRSLIVFRRFNDTYTVWQGSDVDLAERLAEAHRHLSEAYSLADAVQRYLSPRPIVAQRHSYTQGMLRYFEVRYVDPSTLDRIDLAPALGADGLVLLCIPRTPAEAEEATAWVVAEPAAGNSALVVGIAQRTARFAELVHELRCLHWVRKETPELRDDPVARRELRTRLDGVESLLRQELARTLSTERLANADACRWFVRGKDESARARRGLSHLLSWLCDDLYSQNPRIWNELINRRSLSSQGAAARRNLIDAMWTRGHEPGLGIEGYPPERSMYASILEKGGLHRPSANGSNAFHAPLEIDPLRLLPIWQSLDQIVFAEPPEPRSVAEIFQVLNAPPFGLSEGVFPVIFCAFVLANASETTLYYEGTLLPEPRVADWEVLIRRPELFAVAGCRVTGARARVVARLAQGLGVEDAALPVVRDLIRRLKSLPEHVWRTKHLSPATLAVRQAIDTARSPENLLFDALPAALDLPGFSSDIEEGQIEAFFDDLNLALQELASRMPMLMEQSRDQWLTAAGFPSGPDGWMSFTAAAADRQASITDPELRPLLQRAVDQGDPATRLESVLAYIAGRPPRSWLDADIDRFASRAQILGQKLQDLWNAIPDQPNLTPEQQGRSEAIVRQLQTYLNQEFADGLHHEPEVIRAALLTLASNLDLVSDSGASTR